MVERVFVLLLLTVLLPGCSDKPADRSARDALRLGALFPDVALTTLDGQKRQQVADRDKVVVLNVWATWCPPCRRELPSLQKLDGLLDDQHFEVLGMAIDDDLHLVREYLLDKKVTFSNFLDPGGEIAQSRFKIETYPDTFVIGRDGRLLGRVIGEHVWHTAETVRLLQRAYDGEIVSLQ